MRAKPSVAVVGGSLGGLTAALALRDIGCDVTIYERSPETLHARGAGIAVLEQTLRYAVERQGIDPAQISSSTDIVRFLDGEGRVQYSEQRRWRFSAWNTMYRTLLSAFPVDRYLLGHGMTAFQNSSTGVSLTFANGTTAQVDLLVCADGIGSASRAKLLPEVVPHYSGYVGWRGTIPESQLRDGTRAQLHDALTYQVLPDSHILVYPIPGLQGEVAPGERLMNMVWYRNVAESELDWFLTDRNGLQRTVSLPPNCARHELIEEMRECAAKHLAPPIADMVTSVPEPFVQAVLDVEVPRMVAGRSCLLGDAAFAVRPHAAAGTAKAAEDGWVLAEELDRADGDIDTALAAWEQRQLALGSGLLARTREIGESSQCKGDFTPGDPRLVFGLYGPGR